MQDHERYEELRQELHAYWLMLSQFSKSSSDIDVNRRLRPILIMLDAVLRAW